MKNYNADIQRTCEVDAIGENSSFILSVSNLFHFIILSLPMKFYIWLAKNFSRLASKNGEIGRFNRSLLM